MHTLTHTHDGAIKRPYMYIHFLNQRCAESDILESQLVLASTHGKYNTKRKLALNEIECKKLCFWREKHLKAALLFQI